MRLRPLSRALPVGCTCAIILLGAGAILRAAAARNEPNDPTQAPPAARNEPDDPDEASARRHLARTAVRENCLICHGEEMITSQRLTPKQWKAEVEKMVGWGAPLPPERHEAVTEYLAAEYPADGAPYRPLVMAIAAAEAMLAPEAETHAGAPPSADRGAVLYASNCANCHGEDGQGADLGPNLVEKPVLYREVDYRSVVREGLNRMPGFAAALRPDAEADILAWLRDRRFRPPVTR